MHAKVLRDLGVKLVGRTEDVRERFYAISREERPKHPAMVALCEAARRKLAQS